MTQSMLKVVEITPVGATDDEIDLNPKYNLVNCYPLFYSFCFNFFRNIFIYAVRNGLIQFNEIEIHFCYIIETKF